METVDLLLELADARRNIQSLVIEIAELYSIHGLKSDKVILDRRNLLLQGIRLYREREVQLEDILNKRSIVANQI